MMAVFVRILIMVMMVTFSEGNKLIIFFLDLPPAL